MYKELAASLINEANEDPRKLSTFDPAKGSYLFRKLKSELGKLNSAVNIVELVEPVNDKDEKRKWLEEAEKGNFTNPHYLYDGRRMLDVVSLLPEAESLYDKIVGMPAISLKAKFEQEMLASVAVDLLASIHAARALLRNDYGEAAYELSFKFGDLMPSSEDIKEDLKIYGERNFDIAPISSKKKYVAQDIAEFFSYVLCRYGFEWPVVISDTAVAIDVRDKSKNGRQIVIPTNKHVSVQKLIRLIGHEIESHARASMNGVETFGYGGLSMKTDDETLYEGLAMLSDRDFDLCFSGVFSGPLPWYAVATDMARSSESFATVAERIYEERKDETNALSKTYDVTRRIFRGLDDTTNPHGYAFTKDLAYYNGYRLASELDKAGYAWLLELGNFDYDQLMTILKTFKVSPEMIPYKRINFREDAAFRSFI